MSIGLEILASGSAGNCGLITSQSTRIMVDAGLSARKIQQCLSDRSLSLNDIDAIFITHEHGDHAKGLKGLLKHSDLPVYASEGTARAIAPRLQKPARWKIFRAGQGFAFNDFRVQTESIPHDGRDPVAFSFSTGEDTLFSNRETLAWILDLGHITPAVARLAARANTLVLEANHDLKLLEADTKRPWSVKRRIGGDRGHLSNTAVLNHFLDCRSGEWQKIILAHLSIDCNSQKAMQDIFLEKLAANFLEKISFIEPKTNENLPLLERVG